MCNDDMQTEQDCNAKCEDLSTYGYGWKASVEMDSSGIVTECTCELESAPQTGDADWNIWSCKRDMSQTNEPSSSKPSSASSQPPEPADDTNDCDDQEPPIKTGEACYDNVRISSPVGM